MATAYLLVDLTYGDAAKGATVDWLARGAAAEPVHTVVRFNGGPQAGHNVVAPDGRHHTFSSFGSAAFLPGVQTYLSRHVLLNPLNALAEADHLASLAVADSLDRLVVHPDCLVITPFHVALNRLRELARQLDCTGRHGSCGMGIGETVADALDYPDAALRARDISKSCGATEKLEAARERLLPQAEALLGSLTGHARLADRALGEARVFREPCLVQRYLERVGPYAGHVRLADGAWLAQRIRHGATVFEAAQGLLLDEDYGFHPHTTWSHTTLRNANALLAETEFAGTLQRLGLLRAHATRHGAGPFVVEDPRLGAALSDPNNPLGEWQGSMRFGAFDAVATRYALDVSAQYGGVDGLAVSHLDLVGDRWTHCNAYEHDGAPATDLARYDGGRLRDLVARPDVDLDRQERLTRLLFSCRPVVESVRVRRPEDVLVAIESLTGAPVRVIGRGQLPPAVGGAEGRSASSLSSAPRPRVTAPIGPHTRVALAPRGTLNRTVDAVAVRVQFWGVRGSIPAPGPDTVRHGGNTSCVTLEAPPAAPGEPPRLFIFDAGSGIRPLGLSLLREKRLPLTAHLLLTHTHWDHIQGFPFFAPAFIPGNRITIYGNAEGDGDVRGALDGQMVHRYFPVGLGQLGAALEFRHLEPGAYDIAGARVTVAPLSHSCVTVGYRVEVLGRALVYLTDAEPRREGDRIVMDPVMLELARDADLLIHDAQYTDEEYPSKVGWGHSPTGYAVDVALAAGARRLVLCHHDPTSSDAKLDVMLAAARERAGGSSLLIENAAEGAEIVLTAAEPALFA